MTTRDKAEKLYVKVDTFILSCVDEEGYPLTKAVVPGRHRDSLSEMYFAPTLHHALRQPLRATLRQACIFTAASYFGKAVCLGVSWKSCRMRKSRSVIGKRRSKMPIPKSLTPTPTLRAQIRAFFRTFLLKLPTQGF